MNRSLVYFSAIILVIGGIIYLIGAGLEYSGRSGNVDATEKALKGEYDNSDDLVEDTIDSGRLSNSGFLVASIGILVIIFGFAIGFYGVSEKEKVPTQPATYMQMPPQYPQYPGY